MLTFLKICFHLFHFRRAHIKPIQTRERTSKVAEFIDDTCISVGVVQLKEKYKNLTGVLQHGLQKTETTVSVMVRYGNTFS